MKKLSKEKRNQLVLIGVITLAVLGLIYFGLIKPQYDSLAVIDKDIKAADGKLEGIKHTITNADVTANSLVATASEITRAEADMASGDLYSWTYDTIRRFKQPYNVEILEIGHPGIGDVDLLPAFPYRQIKFNLTGTAYYHDLGKFIADFENSFPHGRVIHLAVDALSSPGADSGNEKLSFRMDIIALVKLNPS